MTYLLRLCPGRPVCQPHTLPSRVYLLCSYLISCCVCIQLSFYVFSILMLIFRFSYYQVISAYCRAQWLRGRASDCRLRGPVFESCAAVLKPWASVFTLHCSSSLNCMNEYLATDSGGYIYEQPSRINCSIWLDASQRR